MNPLQLVISSKSGAHHHNADLALALADRAYVINNGAIEHSGPSQALLHDFDLRVMLLGV